MLRHFLSFGSATLISRLLGFIRDILTAALLGIGFAADAYVIAFRFPNLFRRLFAEGGFAASFVPLFSDTLAGDGRKEALKFAEEILARLTVILLILTAIAEFTMPLWMFVFAPGFVDDGGKFELTVLLTRITFPYLLFMAVVALLSGVLNSFKKFFVAAVTPALLNLVLITVLLISIFFNIKTPDKIAIALSIGVSIAGLIQMVMLIGAIKKLGINIRLRWPTRTPRVSKFWRLAIPGAIAGGITQINIVIGTIIASNQPGAASIIYYADRIYQLPLAIIGIALGVIILPELSSLLRVNKIEAALAKQNDALEFAAMLVFPASIGIFIFAKPIVTVFFMRGAFNYDSVLWASSVLQAFAVGLPAFVMVKILSPAFFSRGDTKTPMIFAAMAVGINIICSIILFNFFAAVGIAAATSIAGWANALLLFACLVWRGNWQFDFDFVINNSLIISMSFSTGVIMAVLNFYLAPHWQATSLWHIGAILVLAVLASVIFYFVTSYLLGIRVLKNIAKLLKVGDD